ncbi:MAG: hypothetical protein HXY25_09825 [Alphaproteobacteria bacterium]|nr:hypothetical protein [Alphaproteobacteria bacterium]
MTPLPVARLPALAGLPLLLALLFPHAANGQDPWRQPDESWIRLAGTLERADADAFRLDYGRGSIRVDTDELRGWDEAVASAQGERALVFGRIDDDVLDLRRLVASRIVLPDLGVQFLADTRADEPPGPPYDSLAVLPLEEGRVQLTGVITRMDTEADTFLLDAGPTQVEVQAEEVNHDPFGGSAFRFFEVGDIVTVAGELTRSWFDEPELIADSIVIVGP